MEKKAKLKNVRKEMRRGFFQKVGFLFLIDSQNILFTLFLAKISTFLINPYSRDLNPEPKSLPPLPLPITKKNPDLQGPLPRRRHLDKGGGILSGECE